MIRKRETGRYRAFALLKKNCSVDRLDFKKSRAMLIRIVGNVMSSGVSTGKSNHKKCDCSKNVKNGFFVNDVFETLLRSKRPF
jgi:hypothetical protein